MRVLFKYIFATILQKRIRSLLILFAVSLSGAAILASASLSDTMIKTVIARWRFEYGFSDIVVTSNLSSPSRFFSQYKADVYDEHFEYVVKKITTNAATADENINLHGYTLDTLLKMIDLPFEESAEVFPFEGNKIILSGKYAREYGIGTGDTITLTVNGNIHQFVVCATCAANGPFAYEQDKFAAIIPYEKMQACLGQLGRADTLYLGLKDKSALSHMILRLADIFDGYTVEASYSTDDIRIQNNRSSVPFVFMSVLLCLMSIYVIYVIFQNIVIERMPQMGIFRAMGTTNKTTNGIVLMESAAYGAVGGILSLGLGILILYLLTAHMNSGAAVDTIKISVSWWQIFLAFAISVGVSLAGAYLALRRYRLMSISDLIKQSIMEEKAQKGALSAVFMMFLVLSTSALLLWKSNKGLVPYIILVVVIMASFLGLSRKIYQLAAAILKKMVISAKGITKVMSLSIQNQRGFIIGATIISVIVATNMIINTITYSNDMGINRYFGRQKYDIELISGDLSAGRINFIGQLKGISDVSENYYSGTVKVKGQSITIYRIHGINTYKADEFVEYDWESSSTFPISELDSGRNILLTQELKGIYGVNEGDEIVLQIYDYKGNYKEAAYRIIGFFDDKFTKLGRYALISKGSFRDDFKARNYSSIYIKTNNLDDAAASLQNAYYDTNAVMNTRLEEIDVTRKENYLIISAMAWISFLSAVTGILGMIFIMLLTFRSRSQELSIYCAIGLTKKYISRLLLSEMLAAGICGTGIGLILGAMISYIALPRLIYSLQIAMGIYFSAKSWAVSFSLGIGVCILSALFGIIFFKKMSIMEGLRYE